jgi:hypothetical protein
MKTIELANHLQKVYPKLNFRNHCYLRIAYDTVVGSKWDTVIERPFVAKASRIQVDRVDELLRLYIEDKDLLLEHNLKSLEYRGKLKAKV